MTRLLSMVVMARCMVGMPTGYDSISSPSNSLCTPICVRAAYGRERRCRGSVVSDREQRGRIAARGMHYTYVDHADRF